MRLTSYNISAKSRKKKIREQKMGLIGRQENHAHRLLLNNQCWPRN